MIVFAKEPGDFSEVPLKISSDLTIKDLAEFTDMINNEGCYVNFEEMGFDSEYAYVTVVVSQDDWHSIESVIEKTDGIGIDFDALVEDDE